MHKQFEYIGRAHEYDVRRVFSSYGTDWQERVDFKRLREERLQKTREMMKQHNLGAMILLNGANIRYASGVFQGVWKWAVPISYLVLPIEGQPVLFQTAGADMECSILDCSWLGGQIRPAITWVWTENAMPSMVKRFADGVFQLIKENKLDKETIGIDLWDMGAVKALEELGLRMGSAWPAMSGARTVKTKDELELLKISCSIGDACFYRIRDEWLKPGITERSLAAKITEYLLSQGFESVFEIIVASGGNTNPYRRWATDKIIRNGDFVIIDMSGNGPGGYFIDYVRTFLVDSRPTPAQKQNYREVYDSVHNAIRKAVPGATTRDIAEEFPVYDDDKYKTVSLFQFAHSLGLTAYEGMWISRAHSLDFPMPIKKNMYFALETYGGKPGLEQAVRLEQNFVVTDSGPVIFTLFPFEEELLG